MTQSISKIKIKSRIISFKPKASPSDEKHPQEMSIPLKSALDIAIIKTIFRKINKTPVSNSKIPNKNRSPSTTSETEIKEAKGTARN